MTGVTRTCDGTSLCKSTRCAAAPARTVARGEAGAPECREAQAVPRLSPARAQSGTRGPALRWDPAPEQRRDPCRRSIRADDRSEQPLLQRRRAGDGRQLSTLGLILPADGAAKRRADAFGELLLDQVRRRLRDTVHHLFRLRAREQVGQEIADDLRQNARRGPWLDRRLCSRQPTRDRAALSKSRLRRARTPARASRCRRGSTRRFPG